MKVLGGESWVGEDRHRDQALLSATDVPANREKRNEILTFFGRFPSVEGPVSSVDSQFRLLEDLENRSFLSEIREVSEVNAGTIETVKLVCLDQGLEHLRVRGV